MISMFSNPPTIKPKTPTAEHSTENFCGANTFLPRKGGGGEEGIGGRGDMHLPTRETEQPTKVGGPSSRRQTSSLRQDVSYVSDPLLRIPHLTWLWLGRLLLT